jgi:uncharacterized protein YrrD
MLNIVRCSQVVGLTAIDQSRSTYLGQVEEIWLDEWGQVRYLSGQEGFLPLQQVSRVGLEAISAYGDLRVNQPKNLRRLRLLTVESLQGRPLGWVEDFLFDWQTGEIAAYILSGKIAEAWGGRVMLPHQEVAAIAETAMIIQAGAPERLQSETEGLRGFLSEKSRQVQQLVHALSDRLHHLIAPQDKPDIVRVKIQQASNELATSIEVDRSALQEATSFLQEHGQSLQQSIARATHRVKSAFDTAWKQLTGTGGG